MNWLQQLLNPKEAARESSRESSNTSTSTRPEGTKKKRGKKRIWIHAGKAHWFDRIDYALKAYKDSLPA